MYIYTHIHIYVRTALRRNILKMELAHSPDSMVHMYICIYIYIYIKYCMRNVLLLSSILLCLNAVLERV